MPRMALPLTPASSTDITGKDGTKQLSQLQTALELPPAAMISRPTGSGNTGKMDTPNSPESPASPKAPYPIQPSEAVKSRRRSAAANKDNEFTLPPPPTRSRKIIQMQMKPRDHGEKNPAGKTAASGKGLVSSTNKRAAAISATAEGGSPGPARRKQPSTTSAAGRKVARKTAHSLIERRRRSKMNEEFSVLKDMVPACSGEMHKLAILQASIDYVRYLHDCIEKLKTQREGPQTPTAMSDLPTPSGREPNYDTERQYSQAYPDNDQHSPDVEMTGSDSAPSPMDSTAWPSRHTIVYSSSGSNNSHQQHYHSSTSPTLFAQDPQHRHDSYSSASATAATADYHHPHPHYSYSSSSNQSSATTSPAVGPQMGRYHRGGSYAPSDHHQYVPGSGSALTSPALGPLEQRDLDQEATAALLMLNIDRRGTVASMSGGGGTGRGISVRDLLSA